MPLTAVVTAVTLQMRVRRALARKGKGMAGGYGGAGGGSLRRISRRRFLYGAATAFGGMALASCSGVPVGGSGGIVHFWNLFTGGDGARLAKMQSNFVKIEEHTSELQSRQYLVCRLLLEKKKISY